MNTKQQDRNTQSDDLCIGQALAALFGGTFASYPTDQEFFLSKEQKEKRGFYLEGRILPEGTVDIRFEGIPLPLAQAILRLVGNGKDGEDQGDHYPDECFNDDFGGSFPLSVEYDDDQPEPMDIDHDHDDWF
jgi:hypothetical protein